VKWRPATRQVQRRSDRGSDPMVIFDGRKVNPPNAVRPLVAHTSPQMDRESAFTDSAWANQANQPRFPR